MLSISLCVCWLFLCLHVFKFCVCFWKAVLQRTSVHGWLDRVRLKPEARSITQVSHLGTNTWPKQLGSSVLLSQVCYWGAGLDGEQLELELVPVWNADGLGSGFTCFATVLPPLYCLTLRVCFFVCFFFFFTDITTLPDTWFEKKNSFVVCLCILFKQALNLLISSIYFFSESI